MLRRTVLTAIASVFMLSAFANSAPARSLLAIRHATLIDVSHGGRTTLDLHNATLVIQGDRIVSVKSGGRVPHGARVIEARGHFIVPGLIDGFGTMRNQHHADAYLYEGVTTVVVATSADADGEHVTGLPRSPKVLQIASIDGVAGDGSVKSAEEVEGEVDRAIDTGSSAILLGLDVAPDQLASLRHRLAGRLPLLGEMAATSYPAAAAAGVGTFVRNDRYLTALIPPDVFAVYGKAPNTPAGASGAFRAVCSTDPASPAVEQFAAVLRSSRAFLMPSLAIEATADDVGAANPWSSPAAAFLDPADLGDPVDPVTGARPYLVDHPTRREALRSCARRRQELDKALHRSGVTYLAGSGAPGYGVMPGSGIHAELSLLQSIGLSPREALAAATGNFVEAFGWRDSGQLAAGQRADLLVLRTDPRRDVAAVDDIAEVVFAGKRLDRAALALGAIHPERLSTRKTLPPVRLAAVFPSKILAVFGQL